MSTSPALQIAVVAAVAIAAHPDAGADRASSCRQPGDPAIARAQARAAAWTRASFERTLARRGLSLARLPARSIHLHRGIRGEARARALPYDQAVETVVDGERGLFIGGLSAWSGNARRQPSWEFVQNARGEIFKLIRRPKLTNHSVLMCGCRPQRCGPYGSGCPACGSTAQTVYGPLPPGAVYRGELEVSYPARGVTLDVAQTSGCQMRRCPAPPPSMNRGRR